MCYYYHPDYKYYKKPFDSVPTVPVWVKAKSKHKLKYKVKFKFK